MDQEIISNINRWFNDPIAFVRECFGAEPDDWQAEMLIAYRDNNRVAAKACKGPGKTTVDAWIMWHYATVRYHPKIVATSITGDNLRDCLWSELAKWQQKSELHKKMFTWRAERIVHNEYPETWFMSARKWSQSADAEQQANALAGLHGDNILFIVDEAGGVPDAVVVAAEATLANAGSELAPHANAKLILTGNPTHLSGPLYRACTTEATLWKVIEITGDPNDPKRSKRISIEWARAQIKKYGIDNPWVMVNVLGKFPPSSINALLGPDEVEAAFKRVILPQVYSKSAKILGVDCGGGGNDPSALCPRQGLVCFKPKLLRFSDPKDIASAVAVAIQKWQPDGVMVDNTGGWGSGVISWLRDWGYSVTDVLFSGKATNPVYHNKRTEMIYDFSYYVKGGGCLPEIAAFKEALTAQTYTHFKDKLLMTDKEQLKEGIADTTGFDILDGYALTFAHPVMKKNAVQDIQQAQQTNYDPIKEAYKAQDTNNNNLDDYNPIM